MPTFNLHSTNSDRLLQAAGFAAMLTTGVLALGCDVEDDGDPDCVVEAPSACEETVTAMDDLLVPFRDEGMLDFDAAEVRLKYSDRPGDETCIFDAEVILSKGGAHGCTLTLEASPSGSGGDRLNVDRMSLSFNEACPAWGLGSPGSLEVWGYGYIEVPDLVDEDDSCYAGAVEVHMGWSEVSWSGELTQTGPAYMSLFVDIQATPESVPCDMRE